MQPHNVDTFFIFLCVSNPICEHDSTIIRFYIQTSLSVNYSFLDNTLELRLKQIRKWGEKTDICVQCMLPVNMTFVISSLKAVEEEDKMTPEQLAIKNVGKQVKRKCVFYSVHKLFKIVCSYMFL